MTEIQLKIEITSKKNVIFFKEFLSSQTPSRIEENSELFHFEIGQDDMNKIKDSVYKIGHD